MTVNVKSRDVVALHPDAPHKVSEHFFDSFRLVVPVLSLLHLFAH